MQHVITEEQARKITGGRKPHVPVIYEEACKALEQCISLDETKYWADKSDALAAWAKIYHDDKISRDARALKLRAYVRMGELAEQLRPVKSGGRHGSLPGPISLLVESGLTRQQAVTARGLSRAPRDKLEKIINSPRPPTPVVARRDVWGWGQTVTRWQRAGHTLRAACRATTPEEVANELASSESAKVLIRELIEWLDRLDSCLKRS
jgi:hypothetical protein